MMNPLYMYLPAAYYEHLRSQVKKAKDQRDRGGGINSGGREKEKERRRKNVQRACRTHTNLSTGPGLGP